jgi:hypothetical protein
MTAVHRLIDQGWSWALYHVMHDEILPCVPQHIAPQAALALKAAMTMDFRGVPITCDADGVDKNGQLIPGYEWPRNWAPYPDEYNLTAFDAVSELTDDLLEYV